MTIRDLHEYINNMPRLKAEESLTVIELYALGSGTLKPGDSKQRLQELQEIAQGNAPSVQVPSPKSEIQKFVQLAGVKRG